MLKEKIEIDEKKKLKNEKERKESFLCCRNGVIMQA